MHSSILLLVLITWSTAGSSVKASSPPSSSTSTSSSQQQPDHGHSNRIHQQSQHHNQSINDRPIQFIHITDFHLDPFYNPRSSPSSSCHKTLRFRKSIESHYGVPGSGCDSPKELVLDTIDFIDQQFLNVQGGNGSNGSSESILDFVLWTGDSSRHDRDDSMPKGKDEVFKQNMEIVSILQPLSHHHKIPILPSIGNWDTYPTSQLASSPNDTTLLKLWETWNPLFHSHADTKYLNSSEAANAFEEVRESFLRGGFYRWPVLPGVLEVVSINSLSFFEENGLVRDCGVFKSGKSLNDFDSLKKKKNKGKGKKRKQRDDGSGNSSGEEEESIDLPSAGETQLFWLENVLSSARSRGVKVIIVGHVPPVTADGPLYRPNCLEWFTYFSGEYSDVILTQYYGHINRDMVHFVMVRTIQVMVEFALSATAQRPLSTFPKSPQKQPGTPSKNPYRMISIDPPAISSINLNTHYIASTISTSASIVPVFNPGFRFGKVGWVDINSSAGGNHQNMSNGQDNNDEINRDERALVLLEQSTWFANLERANRRWDQEHLRFSHDGNDDGTIISPSKKKGGGGKNPTTGADSTLEYVTSCSTREDFEMERLTAEDWTNWIVLLQGGGGLSGDLVDESTARSGTRKSTHELLQSQLIKKYARCVQVSLDSMRGDHNENNGGESGNSGDGVGGGSGIGIPRIPDEGIELSHGTVLGVLIGACIVMGGFVVGYVVREVWWSFALRGGDVDLGERRALLGGGERVKRRRWCFGFW
ncbi:Endopolyphosphatase [Blyttiomyces sp. JEL0837]|nr:Endopolyphosphatase [Blyttiomyces sp. JEL0837]